MASFGYSGQLEIAFGEFRETDKMWVLEDHCGHGSNLFGYKTRFRKDEDETWSSREDALIALRAVQKAKATQLNRKLAEIHDQLELIKKAFDNSES